MLDYRGVLPSQQKNTSLRKAGHGAFPMRPPCISCLGETADLSLETIGKSLIGKLETVGRTVGKEGYTLPKTHMVPENQCLEDEFYFRDFGLVRFFIIQDDMQSNLAKL